ncbi:MAG TPA: hypothetical protein VFE46_16135 [Pirellulales bacterium]|jgi:hypothetical protein|nr:hypothetical protein [Pirellulales bacterium]
MFVGFQRICSYRLCRLAQSAAWLGSGAFAFLLSQAAVATFAGEPIAVAVHSGRIFTGEVDSRTDGSQLWLRYSEPGLTLYRPIDWDNIVLAQRGDRQLSAVELKSQIDELKSPDESQDLAAATPALPPATTEEVPHPRPIPWQPDTRLSEYIQAARENNTQVNSVSIDAHLAQWSRTVQSNGIILHVFPLDAYGHMVSVDATLDVELIAQTPPGLHGGQSLPRIDHWTVRITPDQFGPSGAVVKLPFQSVQPEFDLNYGPYGLVHATLNVPGAGSFETSQAMTRIRQYSEVRDEQQQRTGYRYFDVERVDRWAP